MGIGIVTITKSLNGEDWSNNYGIIVADEDAAPITPEDLPLIGVGQAFSGVTTLYSDPGYLGGTYLLHALLAYERLIHFVPVQFIKIDVTDGLKDTVVFASISLSLAGLNSGYSGDETEIVPGNVAMLVNKVPYAFSVRSGRSFYRGVLVDAAVRFSGRGGIDWNDTQKKINMQSTVDDAVSDSELLLYLGTGGSVDEQAMGIPQYANSEAANPGALVRVNPMASFTVLKPVSRQMKRGRKEKPKTQEG